MSLEDNQIKLIVEATLLAALEPLTLDQILTIFEEEQRPTKPHLKKLIEIMQEECLQSRPVQLKEIASGFTYQVKSDYAPWVGQLAQEKPPRYSRAILETLAIVAYRQPVTRAEIEDVRGVVVSSQIIKTLLEHGWIRSVGQKEVPGRPTLWATTKNFLDHFNLKHLDELPPLAELQNTDALDLDTEQQIQLELATANIRANEKAEQVHYSMEAVSDEEEKHAIDTEIAEDTEEALLTEEELEAVLGRKFNPDFTECEEIEESEYHEQ